VERASAHVAPALLAELRARRDDREHVGGGLGLLHGRLLDPRHQPIVAT
jgi:hypothetical protein